MLVAEGDLFHVTRTVDTSGLVGDVSSTIRWGDGTQSAGAVDSNVADGRVRIRFVFNDSDPFFSGANASRRNLLQIAADAITDHFNDDLDAIVPTAANRGWTAVLSADPQTGQTRRINNLTVNENEIVVFAGSRELGVNSVGDDILGLGGPGGFEFPAVEPVPQDVLDQILAFRQTVLTRGESGTTGANPTDQGLWGGSIVFDTTTNWHFDVSAGFGDDELDFISVASHELAHLLGFGVIFAGDAATVWESLSRTGVFTGAKAKAVNGGQNVPLDANRGHFSRYFDAAEYPPLMIPEIAPGQRVLLTPLDLAALDDLGWDVLSSQATVSGSHRFADNGVYPVEVIVKGSRFGEIVDTLSANVTNVAPTLTVVDTRSATNQLDDEVPFFQNPVDKFDVNNINGVTAADALRVINELGRRGGAADLDPKTEQPCGIFLDSNGDYRVSALDALNIINELARRGHSQSTGEQEAVSRQLVSPSVADNRADEYDLRSLWWLEFVIIG